ncbi:MAG: hypothetical protein ACOYM3_16270 [Terrimicrobiaceae bacterium]
MKIPFKFLEERNVFAVPAGKWRAVLQSITYVPNKLDETQNDLRFIFQIVADSNGHADYKARKVYTVGVNYHELNQDLKAFFTEDEMSEIKKAGTQIDLAVLEGRHVDLLTTTGKKVKGHKDLFSQIDGIFRAGTLLPKDNCEESTQTEDEEDNGPLAA